MICAVSPRNWTYPVNANGGGFILAFGKARNTGIPACALSGVALRCRGKGCDVHYVNQRVENPLGAQADGLCSCGADLNSLLNTCSTAN